MRVLGTALLLLLVIAAAAPADAAKPRRVPYPFIGVSADGPALDPRTDLNRELDVMVGSGVQSVRALFHWGVAQPYRSFDEVPPEERPRFRDEGGVPTDWSAIDRIVAGATQRRMRVLPVVTVAPDWAARHPGRFNSPPSDFDAYARFTAALARRFGPNGSFWAENPGLPRLPLREYQAWNEPSLKVFWSDDGWDRDYVQLLKVTRPALLAADPRAKVVLAGLPNESWKALRLIYKAGGRRHFDIAAIHPFTALVKNVIRIAELSRDVMRKYGDRRKPLMVTETSWPSSRGKTSTRYAFEVSEKQQAARLRDVLPAFARARGRLGIRRVYWFTWMGIERGDYLFDYAGLRRLEGDRIESKPALAAYRRAALALQRCKRKSDRADRCAR
jgi:hypothetical protein